MELMVKRGLRPEREKVLTYAEEQATEKRIAELEKELFGGEVQQGLSYQPKDPRSIEKWLKHYKDMKAQHGATRVEGKERVQAEVEIRRLEQMIAKKWGGRIPSYQEYWINQRAGIEYLNLVETLVQLNKDREYAELIRRWRYLRRRMEPQDPNADNILHLFKRR